MRRKAQEWIYNLSDEDITFIKICYVIWLFKRGCKIVSYNISYRAIETWSTYTKMQMNDQIENDAYISLIKKW